VRISILAAVEKLLPASLRTYVLPVAKIADSILNDGDERAVSRRVAMITFTVRVLSGVIAFVTQVLLARWMGDFAYGIMVVVWVGAVLVGAASCLGLQTAILRFIPEYSEKGDTKLLRGVIVGSRLQALAFASLFGALGAAGIYLFRDHIESYYVVPLYLGALALPLMAVSEIQDNIARAFNWSDLSLWPTYVVRPVLILVFLWVAVRLGAEANAVTGMASVLAATLIVSIAQLFLLGRRVRATVPPGPHHFAPSLWMSISLPIFVVETLFNLLTNIDIMMVGHYLPPDHVAVYYATAKTLILLHFVYYAVKAGSAQRFSQYYASGDRTQLAAFLRDTIHWTFWPTLGLAVFLFIFGKPLLLLFGPSFGSGYPLLYILSAGILVRASIGPAEILLAMAGQQRITALVYVVTFLANVTLNLVLIPRFGLSGAAFAVSTSLVVETAALYVLVARRLGLHCSIFTAFAPLKLTPIGAERHG
jgi:O-antigen/teichoic acid export membrane protein